MVLLYTLNQARGKQERSFLEVVRLCNDYDLQCLLNHMQTVSPSLQILI